MLNVKAHPFDSSTEHIWLFPTEGGTFKLGFQRVAIKSSSGAELHLDIAVDNLDAADEKIRALGGKHVKTNRTSNGFEWRVFADPEGNPLCIFKDIDH